MSEFISAVDTAKLIRKALRESFPGVKFSVRCDRYAGGASIDVRWTDGPTTPQVDRVAGAFEGSYFDGSIDYKGSLYHSLDGEPVHLGPDFVFTNRETTEAAIVTAIIEAVMEFGAYNVPTVEEFQNGEAMMSSPISNWDRTPFYSWQNIIHRALEGEWSAEPKHQPQESPTLARLELQGSDGYGQSGVPSIHEAAVQ